MIIRKPLNGRSFIGRSVVAVGAAVVALGMSACSSDDSSGTAAATSSQVDATVAAPTSEELLGTLQLLVDPARPVDEKTVVVVDGDERRPNLEAMTAAMANYPVSFTVTDVQVEGDTATANVAISSPHGTAAPTTWTWENVDGVWKVSDESTCTLLGMARAGCS
ncbi:hypothetical protein ACFTZB_40625 [Rhodococcus sp. NPDC057014]|uniref:hypothetical protein n=1 Tax=Rhodococcus sp. NPDC057014 TaxID=3346000 RepID=UPI00363AD727